MIAGLSDEERSTILSVARRDRMFRSSSSASEEEPLHSRHPGGVKGPVHYASTGAIPKCNNDRYDLVKLLLVLQIYI